MVYDEESFPRVEGKPTESIIPNPYIVPWTTTSMTL